MVNPLEAKKDEIIKKYLTDKLSVWEIAAEYDTYPNKILRLLRKYKVQMRTISESNKIGFREKGRKPPSVGPMSAEKKLKISKSISDKWNKLTPEKKQEFVDNAKKRWDKLSDKERELMKNRANEGMRRVAKEGSSIEKYIAKKLIENGYGVIVHPKTLENEKLEVDILIPKYRIVVEIDGPTHFLPIFGEEKLQQTIKSDMEKNALLKTKNFHVIRLQIKNRSSTLKLKESAFNKVVEGINIASKSNKVETIYLEVN